MVKNGLDVSVLACVCSRHLDLLQVFGVLADARHLLVEVLLLLDQFLVLFPVLGHFGHINVLLHIETVHLEHLEVLGLHVVLGMHATYLLPPNFTLLEVSNEVRSRGLILDLLLLD